MNLKIDDLDIDSSFDKIATELLTSTSLYVNDKEIQITEIEFYYFHEGIQEDNYTHEHKRNEGEWRFHSQGLDITFKGNSKQDGGILIRGIKVGNDYINGPRKIIQKVFEHFTKVTDNNVLTLRSTAKRKLEIIKTYRHLPNKVQYPEYHDRYYRYLVCMDNLNIPESMKNRIKENSIIL